MKHLRLLTIYLAPLLAAAITYWPALSNGYVWDDRSMLLEVPLYRDSSLLTASLSSPFFYGGYYRPLVTLTFFLEAAWGGINPVTSHAFNIGVHLANITLVMILTRLLVTEQSRKIPASVISGFFYGLHPALIEGVVWTASRFDLMVCFFLLSALVLDRLISSPAVRPLAVAGTFILAALCKESAAVFPLIFLAYRAGTTPDWRTYRTEILQPLAALALAGLLVLSIRMAVIGQLLNPVSISTSSATGLAERLALVGVTFLEYAALAVVPFSGLSPIHFSERPIPIDGKAILGIATIVVVTAALIYLATRNRRHWVGIAALLALLPTLNIIPMNLAGGSILAERYLVFPLALLAAWIGSATAATKQPIHQIKTATFFFLAWAILSIVNIRVTTPLWQSEKSLWTWAVQVAPRSSLPYLNLAWATDDPRIALELVKKAYALDRTESNIASSLGFFYARNGLPDEALAYLEEAYRLDPSNPKTLGMYANVLHLAGRNDEALVLAEKAVRLNPYLLGMRTILARIYAAKGNIEWARKEIELVIEEGAEPWRSEMLRDLEASGLLDAIGLSSSWPVAPIQGTPTPPGSSN